MSDNNKFYIGWRDKMSDDSSRFLKKRLLPIFIILPLLVVLLVFVQKPFNDFSFELGKRTTVIGVYVHNPFPMLIADTGQLPNGTSENILLVGYGKFGATGIIESIEQQHGLLDGKKVTMEGTLIYGDGKTVMELTGKDEALISVHSEESQSVYPLSAMEPINLEGEILDPKCYFGVMKPGEGKIHKSCAIRCISGGIPPVFRHVTGNTAKPYEYYLMLGSDGETINKKILSYVGEQISLSGNVSKILDWNVLYSDIGSYQYQ